MDISIWLIATSVTKLLLYFCIAAAISGGGLYWTYFSDTQLLSSIKTYLVAASVIGVLLTAVNFLIQVGAISENGLIGMFDTTFIAILWQSKLGDSVLFKSIGFVLVLIASLAFNLANQKNWKHNLFLIGAFYATSLIIFGYSFGLIGHTAELSIGVKLAAIYHVLLVLWWMGMLYPLYRSCAVLTNQELHGLMRRFGIVASYAVALLILCGGIIAYSLFDSFDALFFSNYGQLFLLKILGVNGLLLIAANHKLRLVPALLEKTNTSVELSRSIRIEIYVGILVLIVTTMLTTLVGPRLT